MTYAADRAEACPSCGAPTRETVEPYAFNYGVEAPTEVKVEVPVVSCTDVDCGFQFMDHRAETIMDAACEPLRARGSR